LPAARLTRRTPPGGSPSTMMPRAGAVGGFRPELGTSAFCGSWKLYWPDGTSMPHDECPMALTLEREAPYQRYGGRCGNGRMGTRHTAYSVSNAPFFDASGTLIGRGEHAGGHHRNAVKPKQRNSRQRSPLSGHRRNRRGPPRTPSWRRTSTASSQAGNRGAERLFGYTAKEAIGKPVTMLIPTERHDEEPTILARIRRGECVETLRDYSAGAQEMAALSKFR